MSPTPGRAASAHPADYLAYQAVIIANVPANSALAPDVQHALNRYVADYGGGLIVTGDTPPRFEVSWQRARKDPADRVRGTAASALARTHRGLSADRSLELDELQLALSRRSRRRTDSLRQGGRDRACSTNSTIPIMPASSPSTPNLTCSRHMRPLGEDRDECSAACRGSNPAAAPISRMRCEIAEHEILADWPSRP